MNYVTRAGVASHVAARQTTMFRLDGKAVEVSGPVHLAEGDRVSVVGKERDGTLHSFAMRNESTGVITRKRVHPELQMAGITSLFVGAGCAACGAWAGLGSNGIIGLVGAIPLMLTGVPGLVFFYVYRKQRDEILRAAEILHATPPPAR